MMPSFITRSYQKEILDSEDIPFVDIEQNMKELNFINTYLGGHGITLKGFQQLAPTSIKELLICEIGCGGGDNLFVIQQFCLRKNIQHQLIGIDIKQECIDVAKQHLPDAYFIVKDYQKALFVQQPDIVFSSLFCHHFTNEQLIAQLQWMYDNSSQGFFINDLQRHPLAYYSIKWLTSVFSKSYLVKNDAPLSVLRGFTKKEWADLLQRAGIANYSIQWKWAFRFLIIVKKNNP